MPKSRYLTKKFPKSVAYSKLFRIFGFAEDTDIGNEKKNEFSFCISLVFSYLCIAFHNTDFYGRTTRID